MHVQTKSVLFVGSLDEFLVPCLPQGIGAKREDLGFQQWHKKIQEFLDMEMLSPFVSVAVRGMQSSRGTNPRGLLSPAKDLKLHLSRLHMTDFDRLGGSKSYFNPIIVQFLLEFAIDDQNYQKDQHGDYCNRYNPICSHPGPRSVRNPKGPCMVKGMKYLRAIPLSVFTLRSTYPSLSNIVALVC